MAEKMTLDQAIAQRDAWLAASLAVATGQEYSIQNGTSIRHLVKADAKYITTMIDYWERKVIALSPDPDKPSRIHYVVPI